MKNHSRVVSVCALIISGILLVGDLTFFRNTSGFLPVDALLLLALMACLGYLFKQAGEHIKGADSTPPGGPEFLQQTSSFHVQLGNEISEQLSSAHTELGNTQAILNDAIAKLVSNFIAISDGVRDLSEHTNSFSKQIHELVGNLGNSLSDSERSASVLTSGDAASLKESNQRVHAMMLDLSSFNEIVAKNAIELNMISSNVEQNVLVVISTLQFQDMSSQLIEHARMRMAALQEVANEMGKGRAGSPTHKEYMEQIAAYNRLLDKHVVSLDKQKANPVAQKDFGTGDIELF